MEQCYAAVGKLFKMRYCLWRLPWGDVQHPSNLSAEFVEETEELDEDFDINMLDIFT